MREIKPTLKDVPSSDINDLFFNSGKVDEFVTSLQHSYTDRFGKCHRTVEGMNWIVDQLIEQFKIDVNQAIIAAGYITLDSFQQGAQLPNNEITLRNHVLRDESTGEYYRWDGDLPKQVPAGSTPQSTGGIDKGAWVGVGDASLRGDLNKETGAGLIGINGWGTVDVAIGNLAKETSKLSSFIDSTSGGLLQFSQIVQGLVINNEWSISHAVILGDSISHGASALDIYNNAYVSHVKRMLNMSNNSNEWGFISIKDQIGSSAGINQERHKVTLNGWTVPVNADAGHTVNGAYATTTSIDNDLVVKIPPTCKFFRVWYTKQIGGGTFTVTRDGVVLNTVNTAISSGGKQGWFWVVNPNATCNPDETGICTISIRNTTEGKPVEILGVSYANDFSALQVNNFSQAGRKLIQVDDIVLEKAVTGANPFILALGHNDRNGTTSENALFTAKIDKIIQVAVAQKVRVIVCDFCWDKDITNHVRSELKRCANSISDAIWLPFPQFLMPNSDGAPASWYKDTLKFTSDGSHPTPFGHKLIAESLGKAMGLSVTSSQMAIDKNFTAFDLTASGLINSVAARYEYYAGYRIEQNGVSIRAGLRKSGASTVPAGTYKIGNLEGVFLPSIANIAQDGFVVSVASGANPEVNIIVPAGYTKSTVTLNVYLARNT
ncbi:hypothetical protein QDQ39_20365 [Providencia rettgeri]|uniref:tail fiber/spike domain-containing protein n=1 Tax=Providencia TaxID=586 RepID=UPI00244CEF8D|nr:hypothetical protein [Providencia rettgeri]MDH2398163.1 hypothetical protein [Providencia rettgeri]